MKASRTAAASKKSSRAGTGIASRSATTSSSAQAPPPTSPITRSPALKRPARQPRLDHLARVLQARHVGGHAGRRRVEPHRLQQVGAVERGGPHASPSAARARVWGTPARRASARRAPEGRSRTPASGARLTHGHSRGERATGVPCAPMNVFAQRRQQLLAKLERPVLLFAGGPICPQLPGQPVPLSRRLELPLLLRVARGRLSAALFDPADGKMTLFLPERTVEDALWHGATESPSTRRRRATGSTRCSPSSGWKKR